MNKFVFILGCAIMLAGFATGALAQTSSHSHAPMEPAAMTKMMQQKMPSATDNASTKAYKEADMKMMQDMHITYSGNSDVDFVRGMIPHHQGAIAMARVQLQYGKNPQMKKMAMKIISDQEKEIAQMESWLKKNAP